jgi:hypothetical protein
MKGMAINEKKKKPFVDKEPVFIYFYIGNFGRAFAGR